MKLFFLVTIFFLSFLSNSFAQVSVVNKKGTVVQIDSGQWVLSGLNLYNKNSGNVGIGNPSPFYKFDVTGKARITDSLIANSARFNTINSGTINDSIVVIDPTTGILKRISASRITSSSSSSIDSTTASNGLTLSGKDVKLGGALSGATTITTTASNTLSLAGLQSGAITDSILVANPSTGTIKRISGANLVGWSLKGNSGTSPGTDFIGTKDNVDLVFKINNTESGRLSLYQLSTTFGYNSVAAFKSTAIGYGATTTSNTESVAIGHNAQTTSFQSVSVGSDAKTTGNSAIAIGQNSTAAYQASAIGANTSATGNNSTAIGFGASTAQANALILGNSSVKVGIGTSTPSNTLEINSSSNPLKLTGLQSGSSSDSVLTVNSTGVVRRVSVNLDGPTLLVAASRTSSYSIPGGSYSTLNYNSASINIGSAYNTSTGEFTAPANGLYQVIVNNMYRAGVSNDNAVRVRIIANGSVDMELSTAQSPYSSGDTYSTIFGTTFVYLSSGQKVSIQVGEETRTMTPQTGTGQHVLKIIRMN